MMTTVANYLAEFLLARIAEDESFWRLAAEMKQAHPEQTRRYLADCDAKRRIVEWCSERARVHVRNFTGADVARPSDFVPGGLVNAADSVILRFLALPYAGHPGYLDAWRPANES